MKPLVIKNLTKAFGSKTVLRDLTLTLDPSACTVLLGKSGCGKTTFLRLLAGLERPTSGQITLPKGLKLGMMFQEARLMPWLTCRENIALGLPKGEKPGQVDQLLKLTGLTEAAKLYPSELSGGMQQRTALARTLALQADLILMDEPFAALDYFTRGQLQLELLRMQRQLGIGYVLVTHNVDEALLLGDRILVLQDGCLAHEETFPRQEAPRDLLSPAFIEAKRSILAAFA